MVRILLSTAGEKGTPVRVQARSDAVGVESLCLEVLTPKIIEVDDDFPQDVPQDYVWMTLGQLKQFTRYNNFVNVQSRCLALSACFA